MKKEKEPFVSLNHGVTIIHESLTTALLAQVVKALNWPESSLFCRDASSMQGRGRSNFFFVLSHYFFQKPRYLFIFMSLFLMARKDLGYMFFLAGIVT